MRGNEQTWWVCFTPLRDSTDQIAGVCLVAHDVTEERWSRQRLLLLNEASTRIGSTLDIRRIGAMATYPAFSPPAECLAAGRATRYEMSDSAITRWAAYDPPRAARVRAMGSHSVMVAPIRARGVTLGVVQRAAHQRAEARGRHLTALAHEAESAWQQIGAHIATKRTGAYDQAVALLRNCATRTRTPDGTGTSGSA